MSRKELIFPLFLALSGLIFSTALFPSIRLLPIAPFLAICLQKKNLYPLLWLGLFCGLIYDLSCSDNRFGFYALEFCLSLSILYPFRRRFFGLALLATGFSLVSSSIHLLLLALFGTPLAGTPQSLVGNLLSMAIADGFFAFFWFSCPLFIYNKKRVLKWNYQKSPNML